MQRNDRLEPDEHIRREAEKARVDETLSEIDTFLRGIARKQLPHTIIRQGTEDMEASDLAQHTLIKLWEEMQKRSITHYRAYARTIMRNASMDMVRRYRPVSQLPLNEHGELDHGQLLFASSEATNDPALQIEQQDSLTQLIRAVVDDVLKLPFQQRRAMICDLKDQIADLLPIAEAFFERGVDIETINWSQDQRELRSQRVSLGVARKKLRAARQRYAAF